MKVSRYEEKFKAADTQTKRIDKAEAREGHPKAWDKYIEKRKRQVAQQSNGHAKAGTI